MAVSPLRPLTTIPRTRQLPPERVTVAGAHQRLLDRGYPLVMGVLNVTPDSFSDGGQFLDPDRAVEQGRRLVAEGADLLDIGGESTRPGSQGVPLREELRRVLPVVSRLARVIGVPISIDTSKAEVASQALAAGASYVNDITALRGDPQMGRVVARQHAAVILMHMRGTPVDMQRQPRYCDVVSDVRRFLAQRIRAAREAGIAASKILIDPGLGFGKTLAHNLRLMRALSRFTSFGVPVVIGPSRKSFIGATLHADVDDRLPGTLACIAHAAACGVAVVRVHDVRPAVQLIAMLRAITAAR